MRVQGGLQPEDWRRWGQFTTVKQNAAELLARALRPDQVIYCSPLVDPYQPAEEQAVLMPAILQAVRERPPRVFVVQTRGPLVLRDLDLLRQIQQRTRLRVSFSLTTMDDAVRRLYEPHCASSEERLRVIRELRDAGIAVHATLAPLLPGDPTALAVAAIAASGRDLIGDPLHVRATKAHGATTREAARRIAGHHGHERWFEPEFHAQVMKQIHQSAAAAGLRFGVGPAAFSWLTQ